MTSLRLDPPASFDFTRPDEWPRWKRRFQQFQVASGLASESEERQVSTLLYCMGEAAEDTLSSTGISSEGKKKFKTVMEKFDTFFQVRRNVIFERARFNRRSQGQNESIEQFITSLYPLAETCDYGELKDEMIRDRIVVGIRDQSLSERLQLDSALTLEKAKTLTRQREAVHEQQMFLSSGASGQPSQVDAIKHKVTFKRGNTSDRRNQAVTNRTNPAGQAKNCTRCGRGPHSRNSCPAKDATCDACKKKGHFKSQCFSTKAIADVSTAKEELSELAFLNTIDTAENSMWNKTILVDGKQVCFKLDTGAEATVMSEEVWKLLGAVELKKPTKRLCGPDQKPLEVLAGLPGVLCHMDDILIFGSSKEEHDTRLHNVLQILHCRDNFRESSS